MKNYIRKISIGSQLYINKNDTREQIEKWTAQMNYAGLDTIRLFMVWDHLEPKEGVWDFSLYDACFAAAEALNMQIIPTLMAVSPPGWMRSSGGSQDVANLENASFWESAMKYTNKLVERYHKSPALHSWILWNEPSRVLNPDRIDKALFTEFLTEAYDNDINNLNSVYYKKYNDFSEVTKSDKQAATALEFAGYTEKLDFIRFSVYDLNIRLLRIAEEIRKIDAVHPVHTNPHNLAAPMHTSGQSVFEQKKLVDFMGCSAHPSWHSTRFIKNRIHQSVAFFADLMKSVSPDRFWVTELQGGTNIFSGSVFMCPTYHDIKQWVWEAFGSGAEKTVFWCFNARNGGFEGGEWGLLNQAGEPSERLRAVTEISDLIKKHQDLFDKTQPQKPDIYILYSDNTITLDSLEGKGDSPENPRNTHCGMDAVTGAYLMCKDLGYTVQMVSEEDICSQTIPMDGYLIAPNTYSLEHKTVAAIKDFVKNGGNFIADGLFGMKDKNGMLSEENAAVSQEIFGTVLKDIMAFEGNAPIKTDNYNPSGWFLKCELSGITSDILGTFENKTSAITKNIFGKGTAIRIGTIFFQEYFSSPKAENNKLLGSLIKLDRSIYLKNPDRSLRMHLLKGDGFAIMILQNRETAKKAEIECGFPIEPLNGGSFCVNNNCVYVDIPADEVLIFKVMDEHNYKQ